MKAKITAVSFKREYDGKNGTSYLFDVSYDGKKAGYFSPTKEQTLFNVGEDAEFTETFKTGNNGVEYINVRPVRAGGNSNFGRAMKKEQSRYAGFAMSYAKDLCVADKIGLIDLTRYTELMFNLMVKLDKALES